MSAQLLTPYEAHCAAWWLWHKHGYYKAHAARAVGRGRGNSNYENKWFNLNVLDKRKPENRNTPSRQHAVRSAIDARTRLFQQTPYYKALKRDIGDLRALPVLQNRKSK